MLKQDNKHEHIHVDVCIFCEMFIEHQDFGPCTDILYACVPAFCFNQKNNWSAQFKQTILCRVEISLNQYPRCSFLYCFILVSLFFAGMRSTHVEERGGSGILRK